MSDESDVDFGAASDASSMFELPTKKAPAKKAAAPKKAPAKKAAPKKRAATVNDDSDADASITPPSKKQKKAPAKPKAAAKPKAKAAAKPVSDDDEEEADDYMENGTDDMDIEAEVNGELAPKPAKKKTSTETYQKLTQLEHILKRPDTYVGSVEETERAMWVFDSETQMMNWKTIKMVPGLYKIFDEILVNAADNKVRDPTMDTLKVTFSRENNEVSVYNNGRGIPISVHETEKIYIPELIFGHLLTSSNYDDDEKKVTGGRNGYGAKLCNIFSTEFTVETADKSSKQKYKQTWTNNMGTVGKPKITSNSKGEEYTKISFKPDLEKFGMKEMDADLEGIIKRRVYDLAGTVKGVKVFLNGERISKIKNFKQYCEMYVKALREEAGGDEKTEIIHQVINDRWEIAFGISNGQFQQVSFVNSIATTSGGTHVNNVADQLCAKLVDFIKKKNKSGAAVKPAQMRNHFFLFVNAQIENPAFTSQTKEQLTTKPSAFGSKCPLPDDFIAKVKKTEVIQNIIDFANLKADKALKKTDGSRRNRIHNASLTDANKAGTKDGPLCTLILTEGLSACLLALAGISAINGRDRYGVFPLRGKVLNVRDASHDQIMKNAEIQNIKQILGLQHKKHYDSTKDLRYGHIMIMTDQDHDGSHIKGLLINFFETQYPSLLKIPNFLIEFITPIVKVFKGNPKKPTKELAFFTMPEYEYWKENNTEGGQWKHKYYKGLGTSDNEDAKVYFADLDKHMKRFHTMEDEGKKLIELAFSKTKADERKEWLRLYKPGTYLDHTQDMISYPDFVNKELILFSIADCARSIPSVVDGLKPGQRKIMFAAFKRNLKNELKVAQLAGYVSEHTGYMHGEVSLQGTIVAMGQVFAGSNNVNLLEPSGNFGSRMQGGKDAASARYIYTSLAGFTRCVLPPQDDRLLNYNVEDGTRIEPQWYAPVLPMILVNGAEGIGTGWSTSIPSFNPEDLVRNIKHLMAGEELEPLVPWYRGWSGTVNRIGDNKFQFVGTITQIDELRVEVTELPVKMWTQQFKERLEDIIKGEKAPSFVKDYVDYNSPTKVHFIITMESEKAMQEALKVGLVEKFKLTTSMTTSNLVAFDPEGRINRYSTVEDILKEHYFIRLKYYQLRKERLLVDLNNELLKLSNQARFIQMIIKKELIVSGRKRAEIIAQLQKLNFPTFSKKKEAEMAGEAEPTLEEINEDETEEDQAEAKNEKVGDGYNYLLGMAIWSLTDEKANKLLKDVGDKELEIDILQKKSPKDLWSTDLEAFLEQWHFQLAEDLRMEQTVVKKKGSKIIKGRAKKKNEDDESDYDSPVAKKRKAPAKAAPTKAGAAKKQSTLSFAASSNDLPDEKPPVKKAAGRAAAKKPTIVEELSDALSDDDFGVIEQTAAASKPKPKRVEPKKAPAAKEESSDDDFDMIGSLNKKDNANDAANDADSFMTADEAPSPKKDSSDFEMSEEEVEPKYAALRKSVPTGGPAAKRAAKPAAKPAAKKAAAAKPPPVKETVFDIDSDEEAQVPSPAKSRVKRATATRKSIMDSSDEDDEPEDDGLGDMGNLVKGFGDESTLSARPLFVAPSRKPSGAVIKAATGSVGKKASARPKSAALFPGDTDEDDDDDEPPPSAKKKAAPVPRQTKPAAFPGDTDEEDEEDELPIVPKKRALPAKKVAPAKAAPAKKAPAPKAKPVGKPAPKGKTKKVVDDSESEDPEVTMERMLDESDEDMLDAPVPAPAKKAAPPKRAAPPKKKAPASEPASSSPVVARPSRAARTAVVKKPTYVVDLSDDDEEEEESEESYGEDEDED